MADQPTLWQRFLTLPRAAQLAIAGGLLVIAALFYTDYVLALGARWNDRADAIEASVRKVQDSEERNRRIRGLEQAILAFGEVDELPTDSNRASEQLGIAMNDVLKQFNIRPARTVRPPEKLSKTIADRLPKGAGEATVITAELRFDCRPDEAVRIIAALEQRPEIDRISKVQIRDNGSSRGSLQVNVTLTVESWVVTRSRSG